MMSIFATDDTTPPSMLPPTAELRLSQQLKVAAQSFRESAVRYKVMMVAAALLAIILMTVYAQVLLNQWNAPFYNSLEQRNLTEFLAQLKNFGVIAGFLLVLNVIQIWLNQMAALYMREGLSRDIVDQWLKGRRAYRLSVSSPFGVNPDQRLHEDARKLSEMTTTLSIGLVQSTILLVSFIGVLWQLSSDFVFQIGGRSFAIPGYMVWGAIIYAGAGAVSSNLVGSRLANLNAERYSREADLRSSLMRANEHLEAIVLARSEETERHRIHGKIDSVLGIIRHLAISLTNLTWISAGLGWLATIVPILIAAPAYFTGTMTFGGLMMAAAAFNQVYSALRWYVDNFGVIADWRAALMRVMSLRAALTDQDSAEPNDPQIALMPGAFGELKLIDLVISPDVADPAAKGRFGVEEEHPLIRFGERIMINGDQGVNRKLLFHALAGLWHSGSGKILMPEEDQVLFVPQSGYLPEGPLRELLSYPLDPAGYGDAALIDALTRVGLERLTGMLDETPRWDRLLDKDEQAALAFANILLRQPRWIIFNDVLEGLDPDTSAMLTDILAGLSGSTLIYIGRSSVYLDAVKPRLLHLRAFPG